MQMLISQTSQKQGTNSTNYIVILHPHTNFDQNDHKLGQFGMVQPSNIGYWKLGTCPSIQKLFWSMIVVAPAAMMLSSNIGLVWPSNTQSLHVQLRALYMSWMSTVGVNDLYRRKQIRQPTSVSHELGHPYCIILCTTMLNAKCCYSSLNQFSCWVHLMKAAEGTKTARD